MKKSWRTNKAGIKEEIMVLRRTRTAADRPYVLAGIPFYVYFRKRNDRLKNL